MAQLPRYDSKQMIIAEPAGVQRDISLDMQRGANISEMGTALREVALTWQKAEDFAHTLDRRNYMEHALQGELDKADKDPDYKNSQIYRDNIQAIRDEALTGFTNNQARLAFQAEADAQTNAAGFKVDGIFRNKMIDHTRGNILQQHEYNMSQFIKTGDPVWQMKQKQLVEMAKKAGFVNEVFAAEENIKVDDWLKMRYIQMAQEGRSKEAMDSIINSDMPAVEKQAAMAAVMSVAKQSLIEIELDTLRREQAMIADGHAIIRDPTKEYVEQLQFVQGLEAAGLPAGDVKVLTDYLNSKKKLEATSYDDANTAMINGIDALDGKIKADSNLKNVREYLKHIRSIRLDIMRERIKGRLTEADEDMLLDRLDKVVGKEVQSASERLQKRKGFLGIPWGYDNAYTFFLNEFNQNPIKANAALVEYFGRTYDKIDGLDTMTRKTQAAQVADDMREGLRDMVREQLIQSDPALQTPRLETKEEVYKRLNLTDEEWAGVKAENQFNDSQTLEFFRMAPSRKAE